MKLETFTDFRTPRKTFQRLLQELFFFSGYQLRILIAIRSWLQLDQKGGKKIENQDFLITFQSGPPVHFSTNYLKRVIKYEK